MDLFNLSMPEMVLLAAVGVAAVAGIAGGAALLYLQLFSRRPRGF